MKLLRKLSIRLRAVKAFLIIGLAALAVYQAGLLWFENISDGSLFPFNFLTPWRSAAINEDISDLTRPFRIISGTGSGDFSIEYGNAETSSNAAYCEKVLTDILSNGEYVSRGNLGYDELLIHPSYVYEYTFQMHSVDFATALKQRAALLSSNNISLFDTVVIQPPAADDTDVHVYFLSDGASFHLKMKNTDNAYANEITAPPENGLKYKLTDGDFAAQWPNAAYQLVTVTNPYLHTYGDKLISNIKNCVEIFFDNPAAINEYSGAVGFAGDEVSSEADGVLMTFSDSNTVVRYYQNDVLEYGNYRAADISAPSAFVTDYAAALSFLNMDSFLANEFYLAGYDENNEQRVFLFDYVINGFPLVATDGGHAIEVAVNHGTVVRYRKLVYNFHIFAKDDLTIYDGFNYKGGSDSVPILGYPIPTGDNETLALSYIYRY